MSEEWVKPVSPCVDSLAFFKVLPCQHCIFCYIAKVCIHIHIHKRSIRYKKKHWKKALRQIECKKLLKKKSRIRETKHLSTDADSSTDTTLAWTKNTQKPKFFEKRKKTT